MKIEVGALGTAENESMCCAYACFHGHTSQVHNHNLEVIYQSEIMLLHVLCQFGGEAEVISEEKLK
jgi:hypothetical protein